MLHINPIRNRGVGSRVTDAMHTGWRYFASRFHWFMVEDDLGWNSDVGAVGTIHGRARHRWIHSKGEEIYPGDRAVAQRKY